MGPQLTSALNHRRDRKECTHASCDACAVVHAFFKMIWSVCYPIRVCVGEVVVRMGILPRIIRRKRKAYVTGGHFTNMD